MAGDWIKMRKDLREDPAVICIAETCNLTEDHVVGLLHRVWSWADSQLRDGNASSVTASWLDRFIGVSEFANAMQRAGWLVVGDDGFSFPHFDRHNGQTAKARALTSSRVAGHRASKCNASTVTAALPEKRREEKSKDNTPLPPDDVENGAVTKRKRKRKRPALEVTIPTNLECDEFKTAWGLWLKFRTEKKCPLTQTTADAQMDAFSEWGVERSVAAIKYTIRKGWQGLREPDDQPQARKLTGKQSEGFT